MTNKKLGIILGSLILAAVVGMIIYTRKKKIEAGIIQKEEQPLPNIDQVVANIGANAIKLNDVVTATFNDEKNFANFYTNNRVIFFDKKTMKRISAGSYSDGGRTINMDNKKVITSNSAWANLLSAIK